MRIGFGRFSYISIVFILIFSTKCFECHLRGTSVSCAASVYGHRMNVTTPDMSSQRLFPPVQFQSSPWHPVPPNWTYNYNHPHNPSWASAPQPAFYNQQADSVTSQSPFIPPLSKLSGPDSSPPEPSIEVPPTNLHPPEPEPEPTPPAVPPPPVIHQGIVCDMCEMVIEGVRHKCLDCPGAYIMLRT